MDWADVGDCQNSESGSKTSLRVSWLLFLSKEVALYSVSSFLAVELSFVILTDSRLAIFCLSVCNTYM